MFRIIGAFLLSLIAFPLYAQDATVSTPSSNQMVMPSSGSPAPAMNAPATTTPSTSMSDQMTNLSNLKNCQTGEVQMPSGSGSTMTIKVSGMEQGKCHVTVSGSQPAAQQGMPASMMMMDCFLSSTTIDDLIAAQTSMMQDKANNVDPATTNTKPLFMKAMQEFKSECSLTVNGKPVSFH